MNMKVSNIEVDSMASHISHAIALGMFKSWYQVDLELILEVHSSRGSIYGYNYEDLQTSVSSKN